MYTSFIVVLIAVLLASAPLLASRTERQREKTLERYARRMNLGLTARARTTVARRIAGYERACLVGGVGGVVVGFAVSLALPSGAGQSAWSDPTLPIAVGFVVGITATTVATTTVSTLRAGADRRIARLSVPAVADYVPPLERRLAPLLLGCAGFALLGGITALATGVLHGDTLGPGRLLYSGGAILGYLALGAYLVARLLTRLILDSGQPAASEEELAWDDALRANALRGLIHLPAALAGISVLATFVEVAARASEIPDALVMVGGVALIAFVAVVLGLLIVDVVSRPSQHYWRRLWQPSNSPGPAQRC